MAQFAGLPYCADAGASDTYACSLSPTPFPLSYLVGFHYRFKANTANTGAATINFNSIGVASIVKVAGGVTTALVDNDIRVGQIVDMVYDGTNMQMQSTSGNAPQASGVSFLIANNLSEGTAATMRTNMGLGTVSLLNSYVAGIFAGNSLSGTVGASTTIYLSLGAVSMNGTEANRSWITPVTGTYKNFYLRTNSTQNAGGTLVCNVRTTETTDGATSITVTAGGTAQIWSDVVNGTSATAGQLASIKCINNYSGGISAQIQGWSVELTVP